MRRSSAAQGSTAMTVHPPRRDRAQSASSTWRRQTLTRITVTPERWILDKKRCQDELFDESLRSRSVLLSSPAPSYRCRECRRRSSSRQVVFGTVLRSCRLAREALKPSVAYGNAGAYHLPTGRLGSGPLRLTLAVLFSAPKSDPKHAVAPGHRSRRNRHAKRRRKKTR